MSGFARPKGLDNELSSSPSPTPNLYVANCGPALGLTYEYIKSAFGIFGNVVSVHPADETGARVIVCFTEATAAQAALQSWDGVPCPNLLGRVPHIRYSMPRQLKVKSNGSVQVSLLASELGIPGVHLLPDFVTPEEEKELLAAVDSRSWKTLAKRRIQHYGFEFLYQTRNVDSKQFLGELPYFVSHILDKIRSSFPGFNQNKSNPLDQLTVNEYPFGVGLSPHIDTHSAFEEMIYSLSLSGPCIMEFRRYNKGTWNIPADTDNDADDGISNNGWSDFMRKAIFLPPRSMLLMSGEGRYAWHHYIPHHKIDKVGDSVIKRSSRRVSFTFRKVRRGPCNCEYKQFCDSQLGLEDLNNAIGTAKITVQ